MIGTRNLAPVLAALLLVAATALAQTADDESAATAGKPPSTTADNSSSATAGDAGGKPGNAERSPSDYRASEKISEDLPVSFPVDI